MGWRYLSNNYAKPSCGREGGGRVGGLPHTGPKIRFMYSQTGTARPRSQFLHSGIGEQFIYSQDLSAFLAAGRSSAYINRSEIHECGKWETEHYSSALEIMRPSSFISGNT